jgi:hypothetical protein
MKSSMLDSRPCPASSDADALVNFRAQGAQLVDMREQGPPDRFLILGGPALHFGNGLFVCFDHGGSISNCSTQDGGGCDVGG